MRAEYKILKQLFKEIAPNKKITVTNFNAFLKQLWLYQKAKFKHDNPLTALNTLHEANVSVRLYNVLLGSPLFKANGASMPLIILRNLSQKDFLRYNGAGPKTLKELKELCKKVKVKMLP